MYDQPRVEQRETRLRGITRANHMTKKRMIVGVLACLAVWSVSLFAADTLTLAGDLPKPGEWTVEKVRTELAANITKLEYTGHDGKHTSSVVPLTALLKAGGVETALKPGVKNTPANEKHAELHLVITVEGKDGFYTVLSMAELMSDIGDRHAYLALDVDGKPWKDADQPMKLILSDDAKPARWVHGVQKITITKISSPTTQPAH